MMLTRKEPLKSMEQRVTRWKHGVAAVAALAVLAGFVTVPPYLGLLAIALVFEVIAFVFPMWWFHREMQAQKELLLEEADYLSERIGNIPKQIAQAPGSEEREALNEELSLKT